MILSRRKIHRFSFIVLAIVLPLVFGVGVFLQPQMLPADSSTAPLFALSGAGATQSSEIEASTISAQGFRFQAQTFQGEGNQMLLALTPATVVKLPDPLVYWQAGEAQGETLDPRAILLGSLSGASQRQFALPAVAQGQDGSLVLYTLGYQRIVATFPFPASMTTP
jgi:hypothetical protein